MSRRAASRLLKAAADVTMAFRFGKTTGKGVIGIECRSDVTFHNDTISQEELDDLVEKLNAAADEIIGKWAFDITQAANELLQTADLPEGDDATD